MAICTVTGTLAGHGGGSTASGQYIVRSAGLVGATVFSNTFHVAGQSRVQASQQFDGIASPYPMAMAYQKLYWSEGQQQTGPNTPQPVASMAAAGIKMLFGLKPSRSLTPENLAAFQATLSVLAKAAPGMWVALWPEANYQDVNPPYFTSAAEYIAYVQFYGPSVVAAGFPLAYDAFVVAANGPDLISYFPGTTYQGNQLISGVFADIYCTQAISNGASLTQIAQLADDNGLSLGVAECGAADNSTEPPLSAFADFMGGMTETMSSRLAAGKVNLAAGWYCADVNGPNGLPAGDEKWPYVLDFWRAASSQSVANTVGGLN